MRVALGGGSRLAPALLQIPSMSSPSLLPLFLTCQFVATSPLFHGFSEEAVLDVVPLFDWDQVKQVTNM